MRYWYIFAGILAFAGCLGLAAASDSWARKYPVFDAHCDTALCIADEGADIGLLSSSGHIDIPRMQKGGVAVQVFALWPSPWHFGGKMAHRTFLLLDSVLCMLDKNKDKAGLALTAADIARINKDGRVAAFISIEGGDAIEGDPALLRDYYRLGVRSMTLTWMHNNEFADSSGDRPRWGGLNDLGIKVVKEMNRLGMVIDVSHCSSATLSKVLEVSDRPVMASHSCCKALCDHFRNLTDDELRALASKDGVVGINFAADFLDQRYKDYMERKTQELKPRMESLEKEYKDDRDTLRKEKKALYASVEKDAPEVTMDRVIEHIDHAVKVAGIEHVGLGSDFDGIDSVPSGLDDCSKLQNIALKLEAKGYSRKDIGMIMGGNFMRLFREVMGK